MTKIRIASACLSLAAVAASLAWSSSALAEETAGAADDRACSALAGLRLPDTTITTATPVAAEDMAKLPLWGAAGIPSICRVVAHVRSAADSDIAVEIWLPLDRWQGVFHGNGNGGFAGQLSSGYAGMAAGVKRGFASAVTDMGTTPASPLDGDALVGHPRKWHDWGRLSTHVMTVTGKAVARAFYGGDVRRSYYTGCSTGGQQGLIEALYYPDDYDGILVSAPVIDRTAGHLAVLWDYTAAHRTPGSALSDDKLNLLNRAAVAKCARLGGGLAGDPFIADPFSCRFDPAELQCRAGASDQCLTSEEVATAKAFYSGPTTRDGEALFYGWLPGSEMPGTFGWNLLQVPAKDQPQFGGLFKWVYGPSWDWRQFDLDRDMPTVNALLNGALNDATRGSLDAFAQRGGKLILHHGLSDALVPPGQTVDFYLRHMRELGSAQAPDTARLFLTPGMMHCGEGPGPDLLNSTLGIPQQPPLLEPSHDLFAALIAWTERGEAPESVIATRYVRGAVGEIEMQRPVCAFPARARYRGGPTSSADSFSCTPD